MFLELSAKHAVTVLNRADPYVCHRLLIAGPRLTHSAGPCRVSTFEEHGIQWCTFLCNVLDCTRYKKSSARIQASSQDATQAAVCARGACNPKACVLVLIPLIIPSRQATAAAVNQASTAVATFFTKVSAWCFRVSALLVHASRHHPPACVSLSRRTAPTC